MSTDREQFLQDRVAALEARVKELESDGPMDPTAMKILSRDFPAAQDRVKKLEEALAFYSLVGNWQGIKNGHRESQIERDFGNIARAAVGRVTVDTPGALRAELMDEVAAYDPPP